MKDLFLKLANGLKAAVNLADYKDVVLGLSGGVDSALCAALSVEAFGGEHVHLYHLPYKYSDPEGYEDAKLVTDHLGTSLTMINITPVADNMVHSLIDATKSRIGNVLARMRMIILYDQSALLNALVVGTGNKSEIMLGYMTLYGDSACAVNPIGELYKTEVWEMARAIGLPQKIIDKTPTADLYEGQTDEKELGFGYLEVDKLLPVLESNGYSADDAVKKGFDRKFAEKIVTKIKTNEFKSRPSVIVKR
jgi:NAD+ synthase